MNSFYHVGNLAKVYILSGEPSQGLILLILGNDPSTSFAFECTTNIFRISDQCLFAAVLEEPDNRLDLRRHRAFGEVRAFGKVLLGFSKRHLIEPLLIGFAKVDRNF